MKLCPKCQKQFSDDANFCPVDAARLVPLEGQAAAVDPISAKFTLGGRLGGGRTGSVHGAIDKATGQAAAVKLVSPAVVALPGLAQRLERELKQLERVQSAGVAKVLASGKRGDEVWVALELLAGAQTLADAITTRGSIPIDRAAQLIEVVGEALIEAAQVGVVHRDLAPKNILFAGAEVKLINFSLPVPTTEKVPGVPEFVAPEQYDGKPVDQRSNLYSLGALYYFVLTGQPIQVDGSGAIRPPSSLAPVPGSVEAVIMRALDRSPTKRFLTVRQFIDEVGRISRDEADARPTEVMVRVARPKAELVQTLLGIRGEDGITAAIAAAAPSAPVSSALASGGSIASAPVSSVPAVPITVVGVVAPSPGAASIASAVASTIGATVGSGPAAQPAHAGLAMPAPLPPQPVSPERSPWAPPPDLGPQGHATVPSAAPAVAAPIASITAIPSTAAPVIPAPVIPPPVIPAPVIPAPVVPAPLLAAPIVGPGGGKKSSKAADGSKGKFRETMWFKKGELDAQAAQAAAEERAKTGKDASTDKADSLPIDERYKDDGSLSRSDKEKYSLRTGGTTRTPAIRDAGGSASTGGKVSEDALIDEMKGGRNKIFAVIAIGLVAVLLVILLLVR
jgi:eukaryotic-like serine/threonine-protein kinase